MGTMDSRWCSWDLGGGGGNPVLPKPVIGHQQGSYIRIIRASPILRWFWLKEYSATTIVASPQMVFVKGILGQNYRGFSSDGFS